MMRKGIAALILSLLVMPAFAQPSNLQADLDAMVAAERAFSKMSVEKGFKDSFLAYISDDGIMFMPMPVKGKERIAARPNPPIELVWWPSHAEIARSGEMGWTTGPWERKAKGSDEVANGHFVTVWKKQPDGQWRWLIDTGIEHPKTGETAGSPPPVSPEKLQGAVPKVDAAAERTALLALDRELGEAMAKGTSAAYASHLAGEARLMRNGAPPVVGEDAFRSALGKVPPAMTSVPEGGDVSAAGDLGYTYGTASWKDGEKDAKAGYLRIWEKGEGSWKLRVDWMDDPVPPPPPPK
jgi:ketosteroid isomerase-like protein